MGGPCSNPVDSLFFATLSFFVSHLMKGGKHCAESSTLKTLITNYVIQKATFPIRQVQCSFASRFF